MTKNPYVMAYEIMPKYNWIVLYWLFKRDPYNGLL